MYVYIYNICLVLAGNPQYYLYQNLSCGIFRHFPMSLLIHLDNKVNKSDRWSRHWLDGKPKNMLTFCD